MQSLLVGLSIVGVAAITPGPNNFIVMNAAAHKGFRGAWPAMAGVLLGSVTLGVIAWTGIAALLVSYAPLVQGLTLAGAAYLLWLGGRLLFDNKRNNPVPATPSLALPDSFVAVYLFQFLNPKSLLMIMTLVSELARDYSGQVALILLLLLLVTVPCACLMLWAAMGKAICARLSRRGFRLGFDRLMGALLVLSALYFLLRNLR
jgi:threonine/homoserine/homoserine lactone efflux protein